MDYWKHEPTPFLIQFTENFGIRYYGLAYILGFLAGAWLLKRYYAKGRSPFDSNQQADLFIALIIGVIAGGRIGYFVFYTPHLIFKEPWKIFFVWEGGMASHGGFIGVALAILFIARKTGHSFWLTADIVCSLAPAGLLFGRIANFLNGELWGKPGEVPWAVLFTTAPDGGAIPRHPSQLYEAGLEGLALLIYTQYRIWRTPALQNHPGSLAGEFLAGYAVLRILGELFREPDAGLILGMSRGSALSILLGLAGAALMIAARNQSHKRES